MAVPFESNTDVSAVTYDAPLTISDFMQDDSFIRFVLGPVGSGKTTGMLFELMRRCAEQAPGRDGIRRTRWAIVRNTLSQLKQTVLRDIETWLRPVMNLRVADNIVEIRMGDIYSEWFLIPLNEPEDQKRLLSMQLTGIWINEFIELIPDLIPAMAGRVGRYPSKTDGGPTWFGIVGDSNMPNVGGDWHKLLEVETPADWRVFRQPGGLSDAAENIENLPGGREYYERLARQRSKAWVKRYVDAEFGDDPDGTAVFRETFKRSFHVVAGTRGAPILDASGEPTGGFAVEGGITPAPGKTIIIGQDFGRNPCSAICQIDHRGRFLVLDEVISTDTGLELHILRSLRPKLQESRYLGMQILVVGDPAGVAKNTVSEETSFDVLNRMGFATMPAVTNDIDKRIRAVDALLLQQVGGEAMFLLDEARCPTLLQAMMGLYRFGKTKTGQTRPLPDKTNPWSDIADALQYAALAANPQFQQVAARVVARKFAPRMSAPSVVISANAWT